MLIFQIMFNNYWNKSITYEFKVHTTMYNAVLPQATAVSPRMEITRRKHPSMMRGTATTSRNMPKSSSASCVVLPPVVALLNTDAILMMSSTVDCMYGAKRFDIDLGFALMMIPTIASAKPSIWTIIYYK